MDETTEPAAPRPGGTGPSRPRMGRTSIPTLVIAGLAAAALSWLLISRFYGDIPALPWLPALTIGGLAALEGFAAYDTKARIDRRPGRDPVDPLAVARYVVLAKASSVTGSLFAGFYAGMSLWLFVERQRLSAAGDDLPAAIAGLVASLALTGAGLWLERACLVPPRRDDEENEGSDRPR